MTETISLDLDRYARRIEKMEQAAVARAEAAGAALEQRLMRVEYVLALLSGGVMETPVVAAAIEEQIGREKFQALKSSVDAWGREWTKQMADTKDGV